MLLALFVASFVVAGSALCGWLFRWEKRRAGATTLEPRSVLERALAIALVSLALMTTANWLLALTHQLGVTGLVALSLVALAAGSAMELRMRAERRVAGESTWLADLAKREFPTRPTVFFLVVLAPLALWVAYVAWRSSILPVASHDGLNYHMPKAVFLIRAHGYGFFEASNVRITTFPCSYELILADIVLLTGSDAITEWPSTVAYLLFLLGAAAITERWWGRGLQVLAVAFALGAMPVALFHTGAHKNDLITLALDLMVALWLARWIARGELLSAILCTLAIAVAVGIKGSGMFLAVGVVVVVIASAVGWRVRFVRGLGARGLGTLAVLTGASVVLLGGIPYLDNLRHFHSLAGPPGKEAMQGSWGALGHLWQFPALAWLVPFNSDPQSVWVPWRHESWWWPHDDLYFSHYGAFVSLAVVALPYCVIRYRRTDDYAHDDVRRVERSVTTALFAIVFAALVPLGGGPLGAFSAYPRYVAFIVVPLLAWTVAPVVREIQARAPRWAAPSALAGLSALYGANAVYCATHDTYLPMSYLVTVIQNPEIRVPSYNPFRAGSVVDQWAGPNDRVAVDGDFDTNLYPVFGVDLSRPISFLKSDGDRPVRIPDDAEWVIVDRSYNAVWNNPEFRDMGQSQFLFHGKPSEADLRVFRQLEHDPGFKLLYRQKETNQAIFRRVGGRLTVGRPVE